MGLCFNSLGSFVYALQGIAVSGIPVVVSSTTTLMLFMIIGALGLTTSVVVYFTLRLRRLNKELEIKNLEISSDNHNLKSSNVSLTTERDKIARDLEFSETFFQSLIEAADDAISFHDGEGKLEFANSSFFSLLGLNKSDLKRFSYSKYIHPEDAGFLSSRKKALDDNGSFSGEVRLLLKGGGFVEFSVKSVTIYNKGASLMGHLDIFRDISVQKRIERELTSAKEEAEVSNKLKTTFVANISHEIRTPLNSIIGFSNLLREDNIDSVIRAEYLEQIEFNSERLMHIIGDIIDLSRLESGQAGIKYETINLNDLGSEVLELAEKIIKRNEKNVSLNWVNNLLEDEVVVYTDGHWLRRVLGHLLENAIKFTIEGSIVLKCSRQDDTLVIVVKDSGIGIDKKNLGRIFDEFRQVDMGWRRTFEGLGIGLSLAREVVLMLGGDIEVKSEQGKGSEFTIKIPFKPARQTVMRADKSRTKSAFNWSGKVCLVVEDNKDVMDYLKRVLEETGITIILSGSGLDALHKIQENPAIDVVLLDMQLPEMSGLEVVNTIRQAGNMVPIIAQTAFIFEDDKKFIIDAGCDACLLKPVRKDHLLATLSPHMEKVI